MFYFLLKITKKIIFIQKYIIFTFIFLFISFIVSDIIQAINKVKIKKNQQQNSLVMKQKIQTNNKNYQQVNKKISLNIKSRNKRTATDISCSATSYPEAYADF